MKKAFPAGHGVPVWDLPTRLFHWLLVGLFAAAYLTGGEKGSLFLVHKLSAYGIFALILFRLLWGVVGSPHSRFASFVRPLRAVRAHVEALIAFAPPRTLGHNPLGGYMVVLLLLAMAGTVLGGMMTADDGLRGPLAGLVSRGTARTMKDVHEVLANFMVALAGIHVCGVLAESFLTRDNLVGAMITGVKKLHPAEAAPAVAPAPAWRAAASLGIAFGLTWLLVAG